MQPPKIKLGQSKLSGDDYDKAMASVNKPRGFAPGNYTLIVQDLAYHKRKGTEEITCSGDASWINVSMKLVGNDGRSTLHMVQVPTQSIFYGEKKTMFPWSKLVQFLLGCGVHIDNDNYPDVVARYFGSEAALGNLEGSEVTVDIGFQGPYVKYVEKGDFRIVINGEEYAEEDKVLKFQDADAAVLFGAEKLRKRLQRYPEILRFHPGEVKEEKKAANADWD